MRSIAVVVYDVCGKNTDGNRNDACSVCGNLSKIPEQRKIICPAGRHTRQNATWFNQWLNRVALYWGKNYLLWSGYLSLPRNSTNAFNHRLNRCSFVVPKETPTTKYSTHRQNPARYSIIS